MYRDRPLSQVMTTEVDTVGLQTPVSTIRHMLARNPYGHVPVVEDGVLVGLVSASDLAPLTLSAYVEDERAVDAFLDARFTVAQLMTTDLVTVHPGDTLGHAAALLAEGAFHAVPVVEHGGRLVGIVTSTDVIRAFAAP